MNLNKLTKAELMLKLKKLQEKSNNSNLLAKLLLFNSLILKFTLIGILIKTFKRYSILRRFWVIINTIIVSIFGISLFDICGLSFFSGIIDTIRSTYIYSWFIGLLDSKQVEEIPSRLKSINQTSTGNEKSSGLTEGIKRLIIKEEPQIQELEDDSPIYKNKWVIIAVILLISGLTWWYFGDDIRPYFFGPNDNDIRKHIRKRLRYNETTGQIEEVPRDVPILPDVPTNDPSIERSWLQTIKDFFRKPDKIKPDVIFDAGNQSDIELENRINNLKSDLGNNNLDPIDNSNLNINKDPVAIKVDKIYNDWDKPKSDSPSECSINHYFPEVDQVNTELSNNEILKHLTGEADQRFDLESNEIIGQVNTFLDYHDRDIFPSDTIKSTMYKAITAKLLSMTILNSIRYNDWLKRTDVAPNLVRFNLLENSIKSIDEQSDTYAEIVNATALEQEAWSDDGTRASTPKIAELEDIKQETPKIETKPLETVPTLRDRIEETKTKFTGLFDSILNKQKESKVETTLEQPVASSSKVKLEDLSKNPEVNNSDSSNNSFERYFPQVEANDPISLFKESVNLENTTEVKPDNPNSLIEDDNKLESEVKPSSMFNDLFKSINEIRDGATKNLKKVSVTDNKVEEDTQQTKKTEDQI